MKKFFVDFIPVEGEVKNGVKYITLNGNIYTHDSSKEEGLDEHFKQGLLNGKYKLVKPFLCSRDVPIQVGDKTNKGIITDYCKGFLSEPDEYYVDGNRFPNFIIKRDLYKIIGEVSPNATWITKGMEFDTYKKIALHDVEGVWEEADGIRWSSYPAQEFIALQCTNCNHYH